MPGNKTKVWKDRGQYLVTVPRALGEALDLAGTYLEWIPAGRDKLLVKIRREADKSRRENTQGSE